MPAAPLADEVEVVGVCGRNGRFERLFTRVTHGARRQARARVGAVRVGRVGVHRRRRHPIEVRAGRDLVRIEQAAIRRCGVGLQLGGLGREARIAKAIDKRARHQRPLIIDGRLALDHRRQRHDLVQTPAELLGRCPRQLRMLRLDARDAPIELGLHQAHDLGRVGVEGYPVRCRKEIPLGALSRHPQLLQELGVGAGLQEGAGGRDVLLLQAPADLKARKALWDGHLGLLSVCAARQIGVDLCRFKVVREQVHARLDSLDVAEDPHVPGEHRRRADHLLVEEQIRKLIGVEARGQLHHNVGPCACAARVRDPHDERERDEQQQARSARSDAQDLGRQPRRSRGHLALALR